MIYASNTAIGTSHNYRVLLNKNERRTYRVSLRVIEAGLRNWRFRYTNSIDSTYADGSESRADMPGGRFRVVSCDANGIRVEWPSAFEPDGVYESAPVAIDIPENGRLVFTWTLEALEDNCVLPGTPDSVALTSSSADGVEFNDDPMSVLPDYFEAERDIKLTMAFMGDSITQGVQTRVDMYEQWAARIAMGIDKDIAVHNIGLGYGRGADAARCGVWLKKAARNDIVNLCFGVNDLLHGSRSEEILASDLKSIVSGLRSLNPGIKIIMLTVPPFDLTGDEEKNWRGICRRIRENEFGADAIYDIAAMLSCPAPEDNRAMFGGHPDWRGGAAVSGDYLSHFMTYNSKLFER